MIETRRLPNSCRIDRRVFEGHDGTCSYEYYIRSDDIVSKLKLPNHLGGDSIWTLAGAHFQSGFRRVLICCNEALAAARNIDGIDVVHLSCVEVIRCQRDDGHEWWLVRIQEDCSQGVNLLREFVRKYMAVAGVDGVEVQTEW